MDKHILFVLGGGIGNIIQATPAIQLLKQKGCVVDLQLFSKSLKEKYIFEIPEVRNVYLNTQNNNNTYDVQMIGPFTPGKRFNAKKFVKTKINYAQHVEEAKVYYNCLEQIGIQGKLPDCKINFGNKGKEIEKDSVVIYPGSKPDWAMKRWNKYDQLASKFDNVYVAGTESDIHSHGNPTWIKKPWNWPENVKFLTGSLQEVAYSISKCKFFVGNDGGLSHVAAGCGVPTFVIFGPSSIIKNKPFSERAYAIYKDIPCQPCQFGVGPNGERVFDGGKGNCWNNMKCMVDLSVDDVYNYLIEKH